MLKEGTLLIRRVGSIEDTGLWATVEVEWGRRGRRWLIMAPSNPNVLTPQAPPPSPKPPGAHVLWLSDRESPAGRLFLPIGKHLVSLNVLCLPHPFFPTQGSNTCLLHCRHVLYRLSHQGSPLGQNTFSYS